MSSTSNGSGGRKPLRYVAAFPGALLLSVAIAIGIDRCSEECAMKAKQAHYKRYLDCYRQDLRNRTGGFAYGGPQEKVVDAIAAVFKARKLDQVSLNGSEVRATSSRYTAESCLARLEPLAAPGSRDAEGAVGMHLALTCTPPNVAETDLIVEKLLAAVAPDALKRMEEEAARTCTARVANPEPHP